MTGNLHETNATVSENPLSSIPVPNRASGALGSQLQRLSRAVGEPATVATYDGGFNNSGPEGVPTTSLGSSSEGISLDELTEAEQQKFQLFTAGGQPVRSSRRASIARAAALFADADDDTAYWKGLSNSIPVVAAPLDPGRETEIYAEGVPITLPEGQGISTAGMAVVTTGGVNSSDSYPTPAVLGVACPSEPVTMHPSLIVSTPGAPITTLPITTTTTTTRSVVTTTTTTAAAAGEPLSSSIATSESITTSDAPIILPPPLPLNLPLPVPMQETLTLAAEEAFKALPVAACIVPSSTSLAASSLPPMETISMPVSDPEQLLFPSIPLVSIGEAYVRPPLPAAFPREVGIANPLNATVEDVTNFDTVGVQPGAVPVEGIAANMLSEGNSLLVETMGPGSLAETIGIPVITTQPIIEEPESALEGAEYKAASIIKEEEEVKNDERQSKRTSLRVPRPSSPLPTYVEWPVLEVETDQGVQKAFVEPSLRDKIIRESGSGTTRVSLAVLEKVQRQSISAEENLNISGNEIGGDISDDVATAVREPDVVAGKKRRIGDIN